MKIENERLNKVLERLAWFFVVICIIGSIANIYKMWWSFALWPTTNIYLCIHNYVRKEYAQSFLFFVYLVISVWGMVSWYMSP